MDHRIELAPRHEEASPEEQRLIEEIRDHLGVELTTLRLHRIYRVRKELSQEQLVYISREILSDPVLEQPVVGGAFDWSIEIGPKEGVTDNDGLTAQIAIEDYLGTPFARKESVSSARRYLIQGGLSREVVERIAREWLGNELVERIEMVPADGFSSSEVYSVSLGGDDAALEAMSSQRGWALSLQEMRAIRDHYEREEVRAVRQERGLPADPTDAEMEVIAQTWSEHCKHKIFQAEIQVQEEGRTRLVDGLFKSYIQRATEQIGEQIEWLVSLFTDNAGIIRFTEEYDLAFKVETHNSPSALDPYGGALTGILGVNRDIMGAGLGARLVANTNVFCFAPPGHSGAIPERLLHPLRVFSGVRRGVEHGGNKMGVPTVNGALVFQDRYLGKPLVYCGSIGILPHVIGERLSSEKCIKAGDLIVVAGGRTGKDGIHGATFSSEELHATSPLSAVQIGNPFIQKKLHDFLLEARDNALYRAVTDNGAGGFSSSVGEMAELSGGCILNLDQAPLKYPGLAPWEVLLSESQERMTLAVPPGSLRDLQELAELHEVEVAAIGEFTDSGFFAAFWADQPVALLDMAFLHHGVPRLQLEAEIQPRPVAPTCSSLPCHREYSLDLLQLLGRLNLCSRESIVRQYDHEVQAGSVVKPLCGRKACGPSDAAVIRPLELMERGERMGFVVSNGLCPQFSDLDAYAMATLAVDEAVRNAVAVGADPNRIAILDNFCWPDPIYHPVKTPDGKHKLGQLVSAARGLYDAALWLRTPIISGKDSMKNDYKMGDIKISIPPTLLISALGRIESIDRAVTSDCKRAGDRIYLLGRTRSEMAGSEYAAMLGVAEQGAVPKLHGEEARNLYQALHAAIVEGWVASCHDLSEGGLAVALAESAIGGGLGVEIDLRAVEVDGSVGEAERLFSESPSRMLVTVEERFSSAFEALLAHSSCAAIGKVTDEGRLVAVGEKERVLLDIGVRELERSWRRDLLKVEEA